MFTEETQQNVLDRIQDASLSHLATLVREDWPGCNNRGSASLCGMDAHPAYPYVTAMQALQTIDDAYGADSARSIVAYFLSNATGWRGPIARAVKAELKRRLQS